MTADCCDERDVSQRFAKDLHDAGVVKCGSFTLKTGMVVPVYFDFRVVISFPKLLNRLSEEIAHRIEKVFGRNSFDLICGVPYTALSYSIIASQVLTAPMILKRKEAKNYGTMNLIDGNFKPGDRCIVIEDTVTSGTSILEVVRALEHAGLRVVGIVALLDREQGGATNLAKTGMNCSFLFRASDLLRTLVACDLLKDQVAESAIEFLHSNSVGIPDELKTKVPAIEHSNGNGTAASKQQVKKPTEPVGRRMFNIIKAKKTNLCVAVDVDTCKHLLEVADILGPYICALKTHSDAMVDAFDGKVAQQLVALAEKHNFLIIEDRKLADIGYMSSRIFNRIAKYADLVTVHALPGIDQVRAISAAVPEMTCGVLLITEMSCEGNLITPQYTKACVDMARRYPGFVAGVVSQDPNTVAALQSFHNNNSFAIFTPGVNLVVKEDAVGQRYATPEQAIRERGSDVIIVGRGILEAYKKDPTNTTSLREMAEKYRKAAWEPYQECHAYELG